MTKDTRRTQLHWKAELIAGLVVFVQIAPAVIGAGIVAFAALGPGYATQGTKAALSTAVIASVIVSIFGGTKFQWTTPLVSLAAVVGALAAELMHDPRIPRAVAQSEMTPEAAIITLMFLAVFLAGCFQILFGVLRLGTLIKFIPYPVIAGFMNGIAVIIALGQIPFLVGLTSSRDLLRLLDGGVGFGWQPLLVGLTAYGAARLVKWIRPSIPPPIVILCVGTGLYHLLRLVTGGAFSVPTLNSIPAAVPIPTQAVSFVNLLRLPLGWSLAASVLGTALTIALIGSIQSLLSATVADSVSRTRHNSNRELVGQGLGNAVTALFGGLASGGSPSQVPAAYNLGSRGRVARFVASGLFLAVALGLGRVFALVPMAVVAVILIRLAGVLVNRWTMQLVRRLFRPQTETRKSEVLLSLGIIVSVMALILTVGIILAIGVGMAVVTLLFLRHSGQSVIRRHYHGHRVHSRVRRATDAAKLLEEHGQQIQVFEVQGPIFFGTSDELARQVEELSEEARFVLLDFKRVTDLDSTGAIILGRLDKVLQAQKKKLILTYVSEGQEIHRIMTDMGIMIDSDQRRVFDDTDTALEWAEDEILARLEVEAEDDGTINLCMASMMQGLDNDHLMMLMGDLMQEEEYEAGQLILAEGEAGDRMFFLIRGTISVTKKLADREVRLLSCRPGTVFGEMALLAGQPRSADVHAETAVKCFTLTERAFQQLCKERPEISIRLLLNIGRELTRRLKTMSTTVREFER
jgi:sulfate permease, SulP family